MKFSFLLLLLLFMLHVKAADHIDGELATYIDARLSYCIDNRQVTLIRYINKSDENIVFYTFHYPMGYDKWCPHGIFDSPRYHHHLKKTIEIKASSQYINKSDFSGSVWCYRDNGQPVTMNGEVIKIKGEPQFSLETSGLSGIRLKNFDDEGKLILSNILLMYQDNTILPAIFERKFYTQFANQPADELYICLAIDFKHEGTLVLAAYNDSEQEKILKPSSKGSTLALKYPSGKTVNLLIEKQPDHRIESINGTTLSVNVLDMLKDKPRETGDYEVKWLYETEQGIAESNSLLFHFSKIKPSE